MIKKSRLGPLDTSEQQELLRRVAAGIDVALYDPDPLKRQAAQAKLRDLDTEFLLTAARLTA